MDQHPPPLQQISDKEKENPNSQTYAHLLESLTSFLIISIHSILYTRSLYPLETFLLARAYNYPVYQSRHPRVCQWVNEAVASVVEQVGRGFVERVAVVIYCDDDGLQSIEKGGENEKGKEKGIRKGEVQILERHIFDLSQFPHIPNKEDFHTEIERVPNGEEGKVPNMVDTEEQLRGALGRLALVGGNLRPLPKDKNCTFGVVVELKDGNGEATPIGVSILFYFHSLNFLLYMLVHFFHSLFSTRFRPRNCTNYR